MGGSGGKSCSDRGRGGGRSISGNCHCNRPLCGRAVGTVSTAVVVAAAAVVVAILEAAEGAEVAAAAVAA
jgi:hypothetical protein